MGSLNWQADLSQRQLILLWEMLNNSNTATSVNSDSHLSILEEPVRSPMHSLHAINRDWRWGDDDHFTFGGERRTGSVMTKAIERRLKGRDRSDTVVSWEWLG